MKIQAYNVGRGEEHMAGDWREYAWIKTMGKVAGAFTQYGWYQW